MIFDDMNYSSAQKACLRFLKIIFQTGDTNMFVHPGGVIFVIDFQIKK